MKAIFLICFTLLVGSLAQHQGLGACSLCTLFTNSLVGYAEKKVSKEDMLNHIETIAKEVCPKVPKEVLSEQECTSFVKLYAPYTVDMIISRSSPAQICSELKLCELTAGDDDYQVIFPVLDEKNQIVTYTVSEKNVKTVGQKYSYRIFLGNPTFLQDDTLTVDLSDNLIAEFDFVVTNKSSFSRELDCPALTYTNCEIFTAQPGRGVWYYIEVTPKKFLSNNATSFTLIATVQNEIEEYVSMQTHRVIIIPILPILLLAVCLCCCCVGLRRRRCKKQMAQECEMKETQVALDIPEMPANVAPMGFYYAPFVTEDGKTEYVQVPLQPMPQPFFYPMAKPE